MIGDFLAKQNLYFIFSAPFSRHCPEVLFCWVFEKRWFIFTILLSHCPVEFSKKDDLFLIFSIIINITILKFGKGYQTLKFMVIWPF